MRSKLKRVNNIGYDNTMCHLMNNIYSVFTPHLLSKTMQKAPHIILGKDSRRVPKGLRYQGPNLALHLSVGIDSKDWDHQADS